jgi:hypothetical protein
MTRLVTIALAAALGTAPAAWAAKDFEWRGEISKGKVIEVKGVVADIHASLASGGEVSVVATKRGHQIEDVDFEAVETGDGVTICTVFRDGHGRSTDCEDGGWGGLEHSDTDFDEVEVHFEVRVPEGVEFVGRTISGDVEAEGLRSRVKARTVSGDIDVSTSDLADASTVSGRLRASMGRADWRGELDFRSVSGDVVLIFADGLDADVEFESLSGEIESDFPITIHSRRNQFIGDHLRGTIGKGGRQLAVQTVSGDGRLRRSR